MSLLRPVVGWRFSIWPPVHRHGFLKVTRAVYRDREGYDPQQWGVLIGRGRVVGGASYIAMGNGVTPPPQRLAEWGLDLSSELAEARPGSAR